jgi:ribosomal-protein-serine acetyltransferase
MFAFDLGQGLTCRVPQDQDVPALYAAIDANRAHLGQWMGWIDNIKTADDELAYIKRMRQRFAEFGEFDVVLWHENRVAGSLGLIRTDPLNRHTEVGYWLAADMQGKGFITRAVRVLVNYAFNDWKMHRVEIHCAPGNKRSRAVAERLGFRNEGTLREAQKFRDAWLDHVVYAMLANEWPPQSQRDK